MPVIFTSLTSRLCTGLLAAAALLFLSAAQTSAMEYGWDRPGLDYRSFNLNQANPAICRNRCAAEPQCRAWTYVRPGVQGPRARCWLKHSIPGRVSRTCCVSGIKQAAPPPPGLRRTFHNPRIRGGYRLDWCRRWGQNCGRGAANEYCRRRGYAHASSFTQDPNIGLHSPTRIITSGQICSQNFCDGFRHITCRR